MKRKTKEISTGILTFILGMIAFCVVTNIWNMDLSIPFAYGSDLSGLLINVKSFLRNESLWSFDALGEPFGTNGWRQLWDAPIPNAIIFMITKITNSVGFGINLYYILSFGLSSVCAYYMMRKCDIEKKYAVVGAVIYALIPGHFLRGTWHLFVGSCFSIPLIISVGFDLYEGLACKSEYANKERLSFKELLRSNSKLQYLGLLFFVIVSLSSIYYGIFALMYLTFCAFVCVVKTKKIRHVFYYMEYVTAELVCVFVIYLPYLIAMRFDPLCENVEIISRNMGDTEYFAGKLIQYILPVQEHRIEFLAGIRNLYDSNFPLINENSTASLGLIMSLGFLIGLIICFIGSSDEKLQKYGKIELFLFMVSTVGGLGAIVGMINYNIRCYNRFSFFIGCVGIVIFMHNLQTMGKRVGNYNKFLSTFFALFILVVAIFDQTTSGMAYSREYGNSIKKQYLKDKNFVEAIEKYEGKDADIMVMPIMNGQESVSGFTKDGQNTEYNEQMLFVQSQTSDWSTSSKAGEKGERWKNWLRDFDVKQQIEIAAIAGFEGIAIYLGGYGEDQIDEVLAGLSSELGSADLKHDSGTWEYYSISDDKDRILKKYTSEEIRLLRQKYMDDFEDWCSYSSSSLYSTAELQSGKIELDTNTRQYGPYCTMQAGLYRVDIYGENLEKARFDCVSNEVGIGIDVIEKHPNHVSYYVFLETEASNVEYRTFNESFDGNVLVDHIEVTRIIKINTEGIYGQEDWGRWAQKECSISYDNQDEDIEFITLDMNVATPGMDGAEITISCGDYKESFTTNGETAVSFKLPVDLGENVISISSSAPDIVAEGDDRAMNIQVLGMSLAINGNEIKINNPM